MWGARACGRLARSAVFVVLLAARAGYAEPTDDDRALATLRFNEGKALLAHGDVAAACRKLEESQRLDPLPGTILNLAACHERQGRTATAVAEFREARTLAQGNQRPDRVAFADERLRALEPNVPGLVLVVGSDADRPDLSVTLDGTLLARSALGTRLALDPGDHLVEASAPGKLPSRILVRLRSDGMVETVRIAPLTDAPRILATPPWGSPLPVASPNQEQGPPGTQRHEEPGGRWSTRRVIAVSLAAAGLAGLGVGTYFGVSALQKHAEPDATCRRLPCTTSVALNDQAKRAADISTASFAAGALVIGIGAFLWFDESGLPAKATAVDVRLTWRGGVAGVEAAGSF